MLVVGWEDRAWVFFFVSFFLCSAFVLLLIVISWLVRDRYCVCSLFLLPLSLVSLIRHYWCIEIVVFVLWNYFKSQFLITFLWISLKKGGCLDFTYPLGSLLYFHTSHLDLCQVFHFSLLICHSYLFLFYTLMLVNLMVWKVLLMKLQKTRN